MASRYRAPSPPYGRRFPPAERISTGSVAPPPSYPHESYYERSRRDSNTSPKASNERVVPVATETYRNGSLVSSSRAPAAAFDPHDDYRRQNIPASEVSSRRSATTSSNAPSAVSPTSRNPPAVIHQNFERAPPSNSRPSDRYDRPGEYYVTPSNSSAHRDHQHHKRNYSIDDEKRIRGINSRERDPDSYDRDRRRPEPRYHLTGPSKHHNAVDEDPSYEYTSPRDVFENTEPIREPSRWRSSRRGSIDGSTRERPSSLIETQDRSARLGPRDLGPPPVTRALEKIDRADGGVNRYGSMRESVRSPPRNRDRERPNYGYESEDADYLVAPRSQRSRHDSSSYAQRAPYSPTRSEVDDRRNSLRPPQKYEDIDVVNRGFGIRSSVDPSHVSEPSLDTRRYPVEPSPIPPDFTLESRRATTDERWRDPEPRSFGYGPEKERDGPPTDKENDVYRRRERETGLNERARETQAVNDETKSRSRHYPQEGTYRDRYIPAEFRDRDAERAADPNKTREKPSEDRKQIEASSIAATVPLTAAGAVALIAGDSTNYRKPPEEDKPRPKETWERPPNPRSERRSESPEESVPRERHYVSKEDNREEDKPRSDAYQSQMDPDEEYRYRVQQEVGRTKQLKSSAANNSDESPPPRYSRPRRSARDADHLESDSESVDPLDSHTGRELAVRSANAESVLNEPLTAEPAEIVEHRENRVRIVEPPKEKDQPKGILRKPTEKFPEDPNPIREGVAPHKDDKRDIPQGMKWTKISRKVVNPEALEEAGERFEERKDFVIVLRAITKEQVQKLADRTEEIRKERENRHHRDRDRRHRRDDGRRNRPNEADEDDGDDDDEKR